MRIRRTIPAVILAVTGAFTFIAMERSVAGEDYKVRQNGNNIELVTPYGNKVLFGENGLNNSTHYRIEIPMNEIKPQPTVTAPPAANITINQMGPLPSAPQQNSGEPPTDFVPSPIPTSAPTPPPVPSPSPIPIPTFEPTILIATPVPPTPIVDTYDDSDKLIVEANYLYNKGRFYDATVVMENVLRRRPTYVRGWIMKGSLMYVQGHKDLARKAWKQALDLDKNNNEVKELLQRVK